MEKSRGSFNTIIKLFKLIDKFIVVLFLAVINGAIGNLCAFGITFFSALTLASLMGLSINIPLYALIIIIIGLGILRGLLRYFEQYSNHLIAFKILAIIRSKVYKKLSSLSISDIDNEDSGDMMALISSDIETLEVFYAHTVSPLFIAIIVSTISLILMGIFSNIYITITLLISYLLIGFIIPIISYKSLKNRGVKYRNKFHNFNSFYLDSIKGIKEIRLFNKKDEFSENIDKRSNELDSLRVKNSKVSTIFTSLSSFIIILNALIILLLSYYFYINKELEIYNIVIIISISLSSFGPLLALNALPNNISQTLASANRVLDLLEKEPSIKDVINESNLDEFKSLKVNNLSFAYSDDPSNLILKNINFNVNKNEIVVIKGDSGEGKSTLLKLLLREYEVKDEMIIYNDDLSINKINTSSLLDRITIFNQKTYLFSDTIKNNLTMGNKNISDEEIKEALKKASIYEFVDSLKEKEETLIDNNNLNISLGEKQRLGLARVILKKPDLLLLDEPTSNIDSYNEKMFLSTLKDLKKDTTIIIITHKESTMKIADRIYELKEGILYEGTIN